jgi:HK97 gp10 family phage protein
VNRSIELKLAQKLDQHVNRKAQQLRAYVVVLTPVDTGRLRQSINVQKLGDAHYSVGTNVEYAPYVEYGTRYQAPQPYFRPGIARLKSSL